MIHFNVKSCLYSFYMCHYWNGSLFIFSYDISPKEVPVLQIEKYTQVISYHLLRNKTTLFYNVFSFSSFFYS